MSKSSQLVWRAWVLLICTSIFFGVWQQSIAAGLWFLLNVLLVGTVVTGYCLAKREGHL